MYCHFTNNPFVCQIGSGIHLTEVEKFFDLHKGGENDGVFRQIQKQGIILPGLWSSLVRHSVFVKATKTSSLCILAKEMEG